MRDVTPRCERPLQRNTTVISTAIGQGTVIASQVAEGLQLIVERGVVAAGIDSAVYGGSFGNAFKYSVISDAGAVGAGAIGAKSGDTQSWLAGYVLAHAGLGCAISAAEGTGCAGEARAGIAWPVQDKRQISTGLRRLGALAEAPSVLCGTHPEAACKCLS
ncbi:DUF637 domain-containing protein [Paraburkholderia sediminicola]|uniref:DUF637 domain-containing protein n=1 Tax=Paraburkholderia sediminicola TaxID=458836 RepID=UPI0038BCCEFA